MNNHCDSVSDIFDRPSWYINRIGEGNLRSRIFENPRIRKYTRKRERERERERENEIETR